ncbi:AraC-like DNA-binding protein [Paenibacillus mucilaginosus]|uniref:helix-turn-helix domain-containing protein n=1 Tax=Paenibacillus mucilaginosus TaxID=61624 RepID=UPI003D1E4815
MSKYSWYTKMILFGCLLSILPVLALGFFSYLKSAESIQSQVNLGNIQIMKQTNGNVEQVLKRLDQNLTNLSNSTLMQDALYSHLDYYNFQIYNNLRREMSLMQSIDTQVTDIVLMNAANGWVINNSGLFTLDNYPARDKLLEFQKLPLNSTWVLHESGILGETMPGRCAYTLSQVRKLPLLSSEKRGVVYASIPACSLAAMIKDDTEKQEVMIFDKDFRIMVHPDETLIGKRLPEIGYMNEQDLAQFTEEKVGQFEADLPDGRASVTYVRSEFNGWIYASFTEISAITEEARSIGWFTLVVCLVLAGMSVGAVWLGSRRMYTPIRGIVRAISDRLPDPTMKEQNEFQLIHEHIQDMFRSNTSLKHELHQNTQQVRTFFLTRWYQGNVKQGELEDKMALYGYAPVIASWEHLAVLTLQIDRLEQTRYDAKDLDLLLFAANNIIEDLIPSQNRLTPVIVDQTQATLVGQGNMTPEEFNAYLYEVTESIQTHIRSFLDLVVSIGISLPFRTLSKAPRAYHEGMEALKHRLKLGEGVIIHYANVNSGKHTLISPFPQQVENELIDSIKLADEERADELLQQWMGEVFHKERSPQEYQTSLIRLLNHLMGVMQESGIALNVIQPEDGSLYEELLQLYVPKDIEKWFRKRIVGPMIGVFRDRSDSQFRSLSEEIIDLIHQHFDTDLTLEECAAKLHYNASYLSSVFKKETNLSFSDYLTTYRFQMAKQWLVETDMPIKDIAQKLGYNNPQNFIRSFRKLEDMTPGQYRTKYAGKEG